MTAPEWTKKVEETHSAKYVGYYDLPDRDGPFYIFWQEEIPEQFRGDPRYDNYFAIFIRWPMEPESGEREQVFITGAKSIREARFPAIRLGPGKYLVSRHRHDFVSNGDAFLDGGLAYVRCHPAHMPTHTMHLKDGVEVFQRIRKKAKADA